MTARHKVLKPITWTPERIAHLRTQYEAGMEESQIRLELNLLPGPTITKDTAVYHQAHSQRFTRPPEFISEMNRMRRLRQLELQAEAKARAMKRLAEFEEQERNRAREVARMRSVPRVRLPYKPPAQVDPTPWAVLKKPAKPFSMLGGRIR